MGRVKYLTDEDRKAAQRRWGAAWVKKNPEKRKESLQRHRDKLAALEKPSEASLKECKSCGEIVARKRFYPSNGTLDGRGGTCKACLRAVKMEKDFGLTRPQFLRLWVGQGGKCGICARELSMTIKRSFAVDHNHKTRAVRGLLCQNCNLGVGHFRDNPAVCEAAARYLGRDHK